MKSLSVIIPCFNEEEVLHESYRRTKAVLDTLPCDAEIIYINDGSRDRTRMILDELAASDRRVKVLHFPVTSAISRRYRRVSGIAIPTWPSSWTLTCKTRPN